MLLSQRPLRLAWEQAIEIDKAIKSIQKKLEESLLYGPDYYLIYRDSVLLDVLKENNHGN